MTQKFRFLGYGDRVPTQADEYDDMNPDTEYWYDMVVLTVGKVYEAMSITLYTDPSMNEAKFMDDEGTEMTQELRFFEEVFETTIEDMDAYGVSPEELEQMNQNALELEEDFIGE